MIHKHKVWAQYDKIEIKIIFKINFTAYQIIYNKRHLFYIVYDVME